MVPRSGISSFPCRPEKRPLELNLVDVPFQEKILEAIGPFGIDYCVDMVVQFSVISDIRMPDDAERGFLGIEKIGHAFRIKPVVIGAAVSGERRCFHRDGAKLRSRVLHQFLVRAVYRKEYMDRLIVAEIRVEEAHQHIRLLRRHIPFPAGYEHEAPVIDAIDVEVRKLICDFLDRLRDIAAACRAFPEAVAEDLVAFRADLYQRYLVLNSSPL